MPAVPVKGACDEAGDDVESHVGRSSPADVMTRGRGASKMGTSWQRPVSGLQLLALACIILVTPTMFALAIVLPIALTPEPTCASAEGSLLCLLGSASLDGRKSLWASLAPQSKVLNWLSNAFLEEHGDMQIKQRRALAMPCCG